MLECVVPRNGAIEHRIVPVWINDHYQPEIAQGQQAEDILTHLQKLNQLLATGQSDHAYYAEMNASYWPMLYRECKRSIKAEGLKAIVRILSKFRLHHLRLLTHKLLGLHK